MISFNKWHKCSDVFLRERPEKYKCKGIVNILRRRSASSEFDHLRK
jgi:hypothetical protein